MRFVAVELKKLLLRHPFRLRSFPTVSSSPKPSETQENVESGGFSKRRLERQEAWTAPRQIHGGQGADGRQHFIAMEGDFLRPPMCFRSTPPKQFNQSLIQARAQEPRRAIRTSIAAHFAMIRPQGAFSALNDFAEPSTGTKQIIGSDPRGPSRGSNSYQTNSEGRSYYRTARSQLAMLSGGTFRDRHGDGSLH